MCSARGLFRACRLILPTQICSKPNGHNIFYNTIEVLKCRELQERKELWRPAAASFHGIKTDYHRGNNDLEHRGVPTTQFRYWSSRVAVNALDTVLVLDQRDSSPKSRKHCALWMGPVGLRFPRDTANDVSQVVRSIASKLPCAVSAASDSSIRGQSVRARLLPGAEPWSPMGGVVAVVIRRPVRPSDEGVGESWSDSVSEMLLP
jgi:hypothetical protein